MSVAKPLPHDAAPLHVTGKARYIDDIPAPANCLHLAFGLSPIASGRLTALDLDAVRAAGAHCRADIASPARKKTTEPRKSRGRVVNAPT